MNDLFGVCILLVVVSAAVADHHHNFTFCTSNVTKCQSVKTNFTCQEKMGDSCTKDVVDGKATLTLATADHLVKYADDLRIVYGQKLKGLEKFVHYYGLAVVQKGTTFNLKQLKGEKSCHTGVGKTVGWKIPVGYLIYTKEMTFTDNQYKSAADFFSESCAPGAKALSDISQKVKNDLCSLCNGTCTKDSPDEPYSGYTGAFICMAEGNKDRVGFVKQDTDEAVFAKYKTKYRSASDYQLLCKDGSKKGLDKYAECNIGPRPAYALVTKKGASDDDVKKMQDLLDKYNVAVLETAGIVSSNFERFEPYNASVTEYVGDYGKYFKALTDGPPDAASSISISFALQIITIFAFATLT